MNKEFPIMLLDVRKSKSSLATSPEKVEKNVAKELVSISPTIIAIILTPSNPKFLLVTFAIKNSRANIGIYIATNLKDRGDFITMFIFSFFLLIFLDNTYEIIYPESAVSNKKMLKNTKLGLIMIESI
jgi:hypothetical protein